MFGCVFGSILRELGDFDHYCNVLNCEFELEKSGLSNEYDMMVIIMMKRKNMDYYYQVEKIKVKKKEFKMKKKN